MLTVRQKKHEGESIPSTVLAEKITNSKPDSTRKPGTLLIDPSQSVR